MISKAKMQRAILFWNRFPFMRDKDILIFISSRDPNRIESRTIFRVFISSSGIIIISARNSIDDKITGLEIGADGYERYGRSLLVLR